jgi:hypothetical protein
MPDQEISPLGLPQSISPGTRGVPGGRAIVLEISPPVLAPWLTNKQLEDSLVVIDMTPDGLADGVVRLHLEVAVHTYRYRFKGRAKAYDIEAGVTGIEVSVVLDGGQIVKSSEGTEIEVKYTGKTGVTRASEVTLTPFLKEEAGTSKREIGLGSIKLSAGTERVYEFSFQATERVIAPVVTQRTVTWRIDMPRAEHAIRDFLFGNLYLYADARWSETSIAGTIGTRPTDVQLFGRDRRPIGALKQLVIWARLLKSRTKVPGMDPTTITFREVHGG